MKCENQQLTLVGVDRSRVVTEKARGTAFQGYLDLSGEHAECLSSTDKGDNAEEPVAILVLEIDNSFSFFVEKAGQILWRVQQMVQFSSIFKVSRSLEMVWTWTLDTRSFEASKAVTLQVSKRAKQPAAQASTAGRSLSMGRRGLALGHCFSVSSFQDGWGDPSAKACKAPTS